MLSKVPELRHGADGAFHALRREFDLSLRAVADCRAAVERKAPQDAEARESREACEAPREAPERRRAWAAAQREALQQELGRYHTVTVCTSAGVAWARLNPDA